jgi:hypothetical protein
VLAALLAPLMGNCASGFRRPLSIPLHSKNRCVALMLLLVYFSILLFRGLIGMQRRACSRLQCRHCCGDILHMRVCRAAGGRVQGCQLCGHCGSCVWMHVHIAASDHTSRGATICCDHDSVHVTASSPLVCCILCYMSRLRTVITAACK